MCLEGLMTNQRQPASEKGQEEDPTAALNLFPCARFRFFHRVAAQFMPETP